MVLRGIVAAWSGAPVWYLLTVVLRVATSLYGFPGARCRGRPEVSKAPGPSGDRGDMPLMAAWV